MRVLVFGDSITWGFWDTEGGWATRLRNYYVARELKEKSHRDPSVFNLGIGGDTAKGVLRRFKPETDARKWPGEDFVFVFAIGTNDSATENGKPRFSEKEYRSNLEKLIDEAKKYSDKIVFVGLTPCEEELTTPIPWRKSISYTNKRLLLFEKVIKDECAKNNMPQVVLFETFQDELSKNRKLLADGLHPHNEGHKLIFQLVRPVIDEVIGK